MSKRVWFCCSGELFLVVSRDRTRTKVLFWDGTGGCLFAKRLEKGRFAAPWAQGEGEALTWTTSEFALFLEGCKLVGKMPLSPPPFVMSKPRDEHDPGVREGGRDAAERDDRPRGAAQSSCDPRPRERVAHPGKPEAAEGRT